MNENGKRLQRRKQEDAAYHNLLCWLVGLACLEMVTLLIKRAYVGFPISDFSIALTMALHSFFGVFRFAGAALFAAGCAWVVLSFRRGKKLRLPLVCTGAVMWIWLIALLSFGFNVIGMKLLCAIPVAVAVLAAIYFIYQREFFFCVCLGTVGLAAIWVARSIYLGHPRLTWCGIAAVCVVMAVAAVLTRRVASGDGKLGKVRVLPGKAAYGPVYLTCAVVALSVVLAVLLNVTGIGYYALFVLAGWLFCLAVYYTVKLM